MYYVSTFYFFLYVNNSSRHSPETFPSPVKTVVWNGLLRLNTNIGYCQIIATYLLLLSLHFSGIGAKNLLFLEAIKKWVVTTYPHLTTHNPRISKNLKQLSTNSEGLNINILSYI